MTTHDGDEEPVTKITEAPTAPPTDTVGGKGSSRLGSLPGWLPWVLVVVTSAVAAFSTAQWLSLQSEANTRAAVERVAGRFVTTLITWDAADGLDETLDELRSMGTGRFLDEAEELFGGGTLRAQLEALEATSEGEVRDLFVQRIEGDSALVFVVAEQTIATSVSPDVDESLRSARIELVRVDGEWRIENVDLVTPSLAQVQEGADDATSEGTGDAGAGDGSGEPADDGNES